MSLDSKIMAFLSEHGMRDLDSFFFASERFRSGRAPIAPLASQISAGGAFVFSVKDSAKGPEVADDPLALALLDKLVPDAVARRATFVTAAALLTLSCFDELLGSRGLAKRDMRTYCKSGSLIIGFWVDNGPDGETTSAEWVATLTGDHRMQAKPGVKIRLASTIDGCNEESALLRSWEMLKFFDEYDGGKDGELAYIRDQLKYFGVDDYGFNCDEVKALVEAVHVDFTWASPLDEQMDRALQKHLPRLADCLEDCYTVCPERTKTCRREHEEKARVSNEALLVFMREAKARNARVQEGAAVEPCSPCLRCGHLNYRIPYACTYCTAPPSVATEICSAPDASPSRPPGYDAAAEKAVRAANDVAAMQRKSRRKSKNIQTSTSAAVSSRRSRQRQVPAPRAAADDGAPSSKTATTTKSSARCCYFPRMRTPSPPPAPRTVKRSEREAIIQSIERACFLDDAELVAQAAPSTPKATRRQHHSKNPQGDDKLARRIAAALVIMDDED